jgi:hypothetical protein
MTGASPSNGSSSKTILGSRTNARVLANIAMRPGGRAFAFVAILSGAALVRAHADTIQVVIDKLVFSPAEINARIGDTIECAPARHFFALLGRNVGVRRDDYLTNFSRGWRRDSLANFSRRFRVSESMHDLERAAKQVTIALKRINDICGHRKFGGAGDQG